MVLGFNIFSTITTLAFFSFNNTHMFDLFAFVDQPPAFYIFPWGWSKKCKDKQKNQKTYKLNMQKNFKAMQKLQKKQKSVAANQQ